MHPVLRIRRVKALIDTRKCAAQQEICRPIEVCPERALVYVQDEEAPLGGRIIADVDKCTGCGLCVPECCGAAIEMQ